MEYCIFKRGKIMSRLDELINELCPDGVEYRKIKDVFQRLKGTPITAAKMKEIAAADGEIKVFAGGKTIVNAHEKDIPRANITRVPAVLVQSRGVIDFIYYEKPFTFKNEMWAYTTENKATVKFLYYILKNNVQIFRDTASGMGSLPQISLPVTQEFEVPLPPLPVQSEIVRILDKFTEAKTELTSLLSAELTARRKQYEYYRENFYCTLKADKVPLSSLGTLTRGKRFVHADAVETGVPCIHYGELYTYYGVYANKAKSHIREELRDKMRYASKGDVIIVGAGENKVDIGVGLAWEGDYDVAVHDACYTLKHNQNPKYISYFLRTNLYHDQIMKYVSEAKICAISAKNIGRALIPLPPLPVQARIVSILDRFDSLCNDITAGLPAEIASREKQYSYYRDRLLSFKRREG